MYTWTDDRGQAVISRDSDVVTFSPRGWRVTAEAQNRCTLRKRSKPHSVFVVPEQEYVTHAGAVLACICEIRHKESWYSYHGSNNAYA